MNIVREFFIGAIAAALLMVVFALIFGLRYNGFLLYAILIMGFGNAGLESVSIYCRKDYRNDF